MRSRISWLVAMTTSAVVISFVVPLCLLVRTLAEDRAMAAADQEARNVAILLSTLDPGAQLAALVSAADQRGIARTSVLLTNGQVLGAADPAMASDRTVLQARTVGAAVARKGASGGEVVLPVVVADGTDVVRSTVTRAELDRGVMRAWLSIIVLGVVLLGVALLIADRLGRRISRPLVAVTGVAHELRAGDLGARAVAAGTPETQDLARSVNGLADRITELLLAERGAVADLSHRLRTPVTALRLDVEGVEDPAVAERLQEHIAVLQRDIDAIVRDARRPVREDMPRHAEWGKVVRDRVAFWHALAEDQGRLLTVELPSAALPVAATEADLRDVVDILVDNVFAHTEEGVAFEVRLTRDGDDAVLLVEDEGSGPAGSVPGERVGSTGLGLDIVRRTASACGGTATVGRTPRGGTRVEVRLPADDA